MPLNLAASDRRLFLWVGAIAIPLIVVLSMFSTDDNNGIGLPSSYSTKAGGAKAAYLLLQELGYVVERWEDAPDRLPPLAEGTVLVLAGPMASPEPQDRAALRNYLERGGKILISGAFPELYVPHADTDIELFAPPGTGKYQPRGVTSLTRGGPIEMSPRAYWRKHSTEFMVHYEDADRPIVVSFKAGRGEVIWWASSFPLTNAGIGASGNLSLFLSSVGKAGKVRILWDEYFHGSRRALSDYIGETPLKFGLLQGLLVFFAIIMTYSRRNGPLRPAYETSRLSPLEFVQTLGNLYRRARAAGEGLEVPYARFRSLVARRLGLPADASADVLAAAIHSRTGYQDRELGPLLHRIEASLGRSDLSENQALEMTQKLNLHMRNLKLIPQD